MLWLLLACTGTLSEDAPPDEGCDPEARPFCRGDERVRCVEGEEVVEDCAFGCAETGCLACLPEDSSCVGDELVICDDEGVVESETTCAHGCNPDREACNACEPGTAECAGVELQRCGADGLVASTELCAHGCGGEPADCLAECSGDGDCDDLDPCTADRCGPDPLTGRATCFHDPDDSLIPDDQIPCTVDVCVGGVEVHTESDALCEDAWSCTVDACEPQDGAADAEGCTHVSGVCTDGASCTEDACDPTDPGADGDGCVFTPQPGTCSDGFSCTADSCDPTDSSADGAGCVSSPVAGACSDAWSCTNDRCDPADPDADGAGCVFEADDGACGDGVDCTEDQCVGAAGNSEGCEQIPDDDACPDQDDVCFPDGCHPQPVLAGVFPAEAWPATPVQITLTGTGFEDQAGVTVAGVQASCTYSGVPTAIECIVPAGGSAGRGDVRVVNPTGLEDTLSAAFTWIAAGTDVDWCNVQHPGDVLTDSGETTAYYNQVYLAGESDASQDRVPGVRSQFGHSPEGPTGADIDPTSVNTWSWHEASPTPGFDWGLNNDEYRYDWQPPGAGVWAYAFRVSRDDGLTWTHCFAGGTDPDDVTYITSDF